MDSNIHIPILNYEQHITSTNNIKPTTNNNITSTTNNKPITSTNNITPNNNITSTTNNKPITSTNNITPNNNITHITTNNKPITSTNNNNITSITTNNSKSTTNIKHNTTIKPNNANGIRKPIPKNNNINNNVDKFNETPPVNNIDKFNGTQPVNNNVNKPVNNNIDKFNGKPPVNNNIDKFNETPPVNNIDKFNGNQPVNNNDKFNGTQPVNNNVNKPVNNNIDKFNGNPPVNNNVDKINVNTQVNNNVDKINVTPPVNNNVDKLPASNIPKYDDMKPEEQAQHRANFRTRFGILRTAWPNYHIPDIPDTISLEEIHAQYDVYIKHIHISKDVDQYKVYLVIMWLIIELACTKLGLNIGGYTVSQMKAMNKYQRLLIELGENNYVTYTNEMKNIQNTWPVEFRILFIALVNAVTFIIVKMLANHIGEGMASTIVDGITSYISGETPQPGQILFGGPEQESVPQYKNIPGGQPLPQMGNQFGGMDIASMLGNLGTMFIKGQNPLGNRPSNQQNIGGSSLPKTKKFQPAYDE